MQEQIINGTYDLTNMPKPLQMYLCALERFNTIKKDLLFQYSFEQFCSFIDSCKESTSASPPGRHCGHYIVMRPSIFKDIYRIMNFDIKYGIILERYKNTVTTLICKETLPHIHRLRHIHLIEIERQSLTKSQWEKQLIHHAERNNLIVDSQYGYRNNRQAQSLILNKTITYNIH